MASEPSQDSLPVGTKRKFDDTLLPPEYPHLNCKRRHCSIKDSDHAALGENDATNSAIDTTAAAATGFSSPLSEISDDRLPTAEEYYLLEQERLEGERDLTRLLSDDNLPTVEEFCHVEQELLEEQEHLTMEKHESQMQEVIEVKTWEEGDVAKLHKDLEATLAQIKSANKGSLTPETFEYLQSEVTASPFYLPEPKVPDLRTKGVDAATNTYTVAEGIDAATDTQTITMGVDAATDTRTLTKGVDAATNTHIASKGVDAATSTQTFIKLKRTSGTQTEAHSGTSTATQTVTSSFEETATQTESKVSDASIQTDPVPKTFPSTDEIYKKDLKYIRRAKPLVSSTNVITVKCRRRKEPTKTPSTSRFGTTSYLPSPSRTQNGGRPSATRSSGSQVFSLLDDDDDVSMTNSGTWRTGGGSGSGNDFVRGSMGGFGGEYEWDGDEEALEPVEFYGIQGNTRAAHSSTLLRYQNRTTNIGEFPSPIVGLRLNQRKYLREIGSRHWRDPVSRATAILKETSWYTPAPIDDKEAITANWTSSGSYRLYKGFPLVEDVEFIVHNNNPPQEPDGDCYWRSVSFCLYGSDEHWNIVKAEHLEYLHYVLSQPQHPRYNLYRKHLNGRFFDTSSVDGVAFKANIWQLLHLAHAWTPAVVSQITADLYNIFVVIFTLENGVASETNVRGVHNSRHIFLCFTGGCHFQPMTPNEYDAWEFRYPRITVDATAKYVNAPKATSAKQTWEHPWRKEFSSTVLPPVPRLHGCNIEELRRFLGSNPRP
ncbi:hypothetical protein PG993_002816 [Apiospora rasikravindrae]|uniref:OTU domain-containing protein n=1 Tax=Apiospora rasikravindrae TaxID=990691 RepID=A0ABR1TXR6_9PEZI